MSPIINFCLCAHSFLPGRPHSPPAAEVLSSSTVPQQHSPPAAEPSSHPSQEARGLPSPIAAEPLSSSTVPQQHSPPRAEPCSSSTLPQQHSPPAAEPSSYHPILHHPVLHRRKATSSTSSLVPETISSFNSCQSQGKGKPSKFTAKETQAMIITFLNEIKGSVINPAAIARTCLQDSILKNVIEKHGISKITPRLRYFRLQYNKDKKGFYKKFGINE